MYRRTLFLAVVHAVLAGQRLDEALQRGVPPHVVAAADRALHLCDQGGTSANRLDRGRPEMEPPSGP